MGDLGWKDIRHIMISVYHLRAAQTNTQMKVVCSTELCLRVWKCNLREINGKLVRLTCELSFLRHTDLVWESGVLCIPATVCCQMNVGKFLRSGKWKWKGALPHLSPNLLLQVTAGGAGWLQAEGTSHSVQLTATFQLEAIKSLPCCCLVNNWIVLAMSTWLSTACFWLLKCLLLLHTT